MRTTTKLALGLFLGLALVAAARAQTIGPIIDGPYSLPILAKTTTYSGSFNGSGPALVRVSLSAPNILTTGTLVLNGTQIMQLSDFANGVTQVDRFVTLVGSNTFSFTIGGTRGATVTLTVYQVIMPTPSGLTPNPLGLNLGASGTLTATLSPTPTASGTLSVSSSNAAVATVPSSIAFASGQANVVIPVTTVGAGSAVITASANGGSAQATVNVNAPPTVSITSPASGALFNAPASITLTANAADSDGTVAKVDFYDGATLLGTSTAAPYGVTATNVAAGSHSLTARATDNLGAVTSSTAVSVTVDAPPVVSLTAPANGSIYAAPASVTLTATASDSVGTITKVDFYQGTTLIGTATTAPYTFNWTNVAAGSYSLTAIATNDAGGTTTSAAVSIKVDAAPTVSLDAPTGGAVYAAPASVTLTATAADTVGVITKVDFYQGTTLIGTATAAPYSFSWTNVASGNYSLTAVATNDAGMTAPSSAVAIAVDSPPVVALTAPTAGAAFTAPANIPIVANVSDTVGTITKVDFYQGTTLITSLTAAPYSFTWTAVPQGSYSLTAVATNDAGETATSGAVAVTVNSAVAQIYYIEVDHLNTPRSISDQAGNEVWRWDNTEPFGDSVPNDDPNNIGSHFDFPLGLSLYYTDKETGQRYAQLRDCYDPVTGRFCQSDPILGLNSFFTDERVLLVQAFIATPKYLHPYAYVANAPLDDVDVKGLQLTRALTTIYNGIRCWYYAKEIRTFAKQCQDECPTDPRGMIQFIDKYTTSGDLDAAMIGCMCKKAGPKMCGDVISSCVKGVLGAGRPFNLGP
jgi:RHS repeat-associated protein